MNYPVSVQHALTRDIMPRVRLETRRDFTRLARSWTSIVSFITFGSVE